MNNNQVTFDPMTGQPIYNNAQVGIHEQNQPILQPTNMAQIIPETQPIVNSQVQPTNTAQIVPETQPMVNSQVQPTNMAQIIPESQPMVNPQQQMQNIPTIEQSKQEFINNTQVNNASQKEEKKEGPNFAFIIVLFVIIFAAIFFLFPYLLKVL